MQKAGRLLAALRAYAQPAELDARLFRLQALGHIESIPTRIQLIVGSVDMLRFWISPAAADYYEKMGINYGFHQLLRILDEPASMVDPTGFLSTKDNIIGHLMQVVHANPAYDLQLLESHEGGLESLEAQVRAMIAGTHPRTASIRAIVEEADYHERLLGYVRDYREHRDADAPIRDNVAADPQLRILEQTFGTLPRAMTYFQRLPSEPVGAIRHILLQRTFPAHLAVAA